MLKVRLVLPVLANPLLEKQERLEARHLSSGGRLRGHSAPSHSRACLHSQDRGARGVHTARSLCRHSTSSLHASFLPSSLLLARGIHTNGLSLQLKAFFWIFSLVHISTAGSACDNIINILIPSWFFHVYKWRGKKNTIKLSKIKLTVSKQGR